ncbi:hypothetical protein X801_05440 [Opisthorchis viverrini]|uniref:Uncharacterized protein n=1 Tax=Opisthorchis viverrini TaxID=6198 RepID=A0A1S8WWC7_OPIVI|nr:hypothetical protein X801_05440 [Opisthorchis viverrini]
MYQGYMGMEMAPPKILLDLDSVTDIILLLDRHHATSFPSIDMRSKGSPEIFEERQAHHRPVPWCDDPIQSLSSGRSMSVHVETRKMPEETLVEDRSDSDVQIDRQTKVGKRGLDTDMISPYEKTRRDRTCIRSLAG